MRPIGISPASLSTMGGEGGAGEQVKHNVKRFATQQEPLAYSLYGFLPQDHMPFHDARLQIELGRDETRDLLRQGEQDPQPQVLQALLVPRGGLASALGLACELEHCCWLEGHNPTVGRTLGGRGNRAGGCCRTSCRFAGAHQVGHEDSLCNHSHAIHLPPHLD